MNTDPKTNQPARQVDPEQDIGGGHAGVPSPHPPSAIRMAFVVMLVLAFIGFCATLLLKCGGVTP